MVEYLIKAALIITPFVVVPQMDARTPKEIFAFSAVLAIILFSLHSGLFKKFNNIWALLFVGFCWICLLMAPDFPRFSLAYIEGDLAKHRITAIGLLPDRPVSGLWMFKPVLFILTYFVYMALIASLELTREKIDSFLKVMLGCGIAMAIYIFIQKAGMDQFFGQVSTAVNPDLGALKAPALGGFLGQSTIVSPFIAMLIPIAIYFRRYLVAIVMAVAVTLTLSKVAGMAMIIGSLFVLILSKRRYYKIFGLCGLCLVLAGSMLFIAKHPSKDWAVSLSSSSSGRFTAWPQMWNDFMKPQADGKKHTVTGLGPGTFAYYFSVEHKNRWWQAHNEPLEALFNFGIVGVTLLSLAVCSMIGHLKAYRDDLTLTLLGCLLIVFVCSLGTFPLQIAPIYLYVVTMLGFLHNPILREGNYA